MTLEEYLNEHGADHWPGPGYEDNWDDDLFDDDEEWEDDEDE